jgi:hypothetical protein
VTFTSTKGFSEEQIASLKADGWTIAKDMAYKDELVVKHPSSPLIPLDEVVRVVEEMEVIALHCDSVCNCRTATA